MQLLFRIEHQKLTYLGRNVIASGSHKFLSAQFEFTDDWDDVERYAQFTKGDYSGIFRIDNNDNVCDVPWEVVNTKGRFRVAVFGARGNNEKVITANEIVIQVEASGYESSVEQYPTNDYLANTLVEITVVDEKLAEAENDLAQAKTLYNQYIADANEDYRGYEANLTDIKNQTSALRDNAELQANIATEAKNVAVDSIEGYQEAKVVLNNIYNYKQQAQDSATTATTQANIATSKVEEASASALAAQNSATSAEISAVSATNSANSASASAESAIQALRDTTLIKNSGNADTLSTANAADIVEIKGSVDDLLAKLERDYRCIDYDFLLSSATKNSYYTGFIRGYNNADLTTGSSTHQYKQYQTVINDGFEKLILIPPTGLAAKLIGTRIETQEDGTRKYVTKKTVGATDSGTWQANIDKPQIMNDAYNYEYFGIGIGYSAAGFSNTQSEIKATLQGMRLIKCYPRREEIDDLNERIEMKNSTGYDYFDYKKFTNGWAYNGQLCNYDVDSKRVYRDRVVSTELFEIDKNATMQVEEGYCAYLWYFDDDGTYKSSQNITTNRFEIPIRQKFRMGVYQRGDADKTVRDRVDVREFVHKIKVVNDVETTPSYFKEEIETTVDSVLSVMDEPCLVFPMVTDIHWRSNLENENFDNMIRNMKIITSRIPCDFVLNLGDNTDGAAHLSTVTKNKRMMNKFLSLGLPYYFTMGNHDTNYQGTGMFTMGESFSNYYSMSKGVVYNLATNGTDFYKDFDNVGIRLVSINSNYTKNYNFGAETATWLNDVALQTNKIVLLATHVAPLKTQTFTQNDMGRSAINNAINAFINRGGTIIQFMGHSHADFSFRTPYLSISSTCQKFEKLSTYETLESVLKNVDEYGIVSPDRIEGTATEDAWNIVVVRPVSRKVNVIRFGAGIDREYDF